MRVLSFCERELCYKLLFPPNVVKREPSFQKAAKKEGFCGEWCEGQGFIQRPLQLAKGRGPGKTLGHTQLAFWADEARTTTEMPERFSQAHWWDQHLISCLFIIRYLTVKRPIRTYKCTHFWWFGEFIFMENSRLTAIFIISQN